MFHLYNYWEEKVFKCWGERSDEHKKCGKRLEDEEDITIMND